MKFIVFFCVIVPIVSSKTMNQEIYKLSPEIVRLAQKHAEPCATQHNVDKGIFRRVLDGTLPHDEPTKKFLYCFGRSIKMIAEDGHMIVDKISNLVREHRLFEEFKETIQACNKITKENPMETLLEMNACLNNNSPVILSL